MPQDFGASECASVGYQVPVANSRKVPWQIIDDCLEEDRVRVCGEKLLNTARFTERDVQSACSSKEGDDLQPGLGLRRRLLESLGF